MESLTKVTKNDAANAWTDEFGVIYSADKKRLLWAPADIREYSVPEGTEVICDWAFNECELLKSIELCNSLIAMGIHAFQECSSLKTVVIPSNITEIGFATFRDCDSLQTVSVLEGVKIIGEEAFGCCSSLESIDLPNSLTTIGDYAFDGCSSLKSIIIPSSVTNIGRAPFSFCHCKIASKSEYFRSDGFDLFSVKDKTLLYCSPSVESYNISDSISIIGEGAFSLCKKLKSIVIPDSVTIIEKDAFGCCDALSEFFIPAGSYDKFKQLLPEFEDMLFEEPLSKNVDNTSSKPFVTILSTEVTEEDLDNAFEEECGALYSSDGKRLLRLERHAFHDDSYCIEPGTQVICDGAFAWCGCLTEITIPNSITQIGKHAFQCCIGLKSITIPDSVSSIGNDAFSLYNDLANIQVSSNNRIYDSRGNCNAIIHTATNTLIVGCRNTVIPDSVTHIGVKAFDDCISLTSITIPNSVTHIGDDAFFHCKALTIITLPNSVTSIGKGVFERCDALSEIRIPVGSYDKFKQLLPGFEDKFVEE